MYLIFYYISPNYCIEGTVFRIAIENGIDELIFTRSLIPICSHYFIVGRLVKDPGKSLDEATFIPNRRVSHRLVGVLYDPLYINLK